jgi:hypothetical protein
MAPAAIGLVSAAQAVLGSTGALAQALKNKAAVARASLFMTFS